MPTGRSVARGRVGVEQRGQKHWIRPQPLAP